MSRGQPRTQYERTYVLLPPGAGEEWPIAALHATWGSHRYTVGGSADDAGIGDLGVRRVIAVNPHLWPGPVEWFFNEYYPGAQVTIIRAETPQALIEALADQQQPPPPRPGVYTLRGVHDRAGADWLKAEGLAGWCLIPVYLNTTPQNLQLGGYAEAGIRVLVNLRYSYAVDDGGQGTMPGPNQITAFENACIGTMRTNPAAWGFVYCNEMNNSREWPKEKDYPLSPGYYLDSYNRVWSAKPDRARLLPGAIDPYNPGWGDWRKGWGEVLKSLAGCDGLAWHAYTHGPDPALIWHHKRFGDDPLTGVFYDLRVLESQQAIILDKFKDKPQIVTECNHFVRHDGKIGWEANSGPWVTEAYQYFASRGVAGACLFRFNHNDWKFGNLPDVLCALRNITP